MNFAGSRLATLIRFGLKALVACAILAVLSLAVEWYRFAQSLPDRGWNPTMARILGLLIANLFFAALLAIVAVLYLWGRFATSLPDLQGWHLQKPDSEFRAADADADYQLTSYLEQEERVFAELDTLVAGPWNEQPPGDYCRYHADSVCNPDKLLDHNWNRSFVLRAPNPIGGVLLLHGLSDSPYSLRSLGQRFHAEGFTVVWLRIPGHGTSPSALANVSWQDWTTAVQVAMRGLRDQVPKNLPLLLGGYSNGGALSLYYTLASLDEASLPQPTAIVLLSPMIGISTMARITWLYHLVGMVFRNRKAQWSRIDAEIDPFKYCSWPMNASVQAWAVTQLVERKLAAFSKSGRMREVPPILALQSVVDSTVVVPKLITVLFERVATKASELFLFDINRVDRLVNLFNLSFEKSIFPKLNRTDLPFKLTILRNASSNSQEVVVQTRDAESLVESTTNMSWPAGIVSLSHIAVPISPADPVYGTSEATATSGLPLGTISVRAEPSALLISDSMFIRCRHNPFYQFIEDRVVTWVFDVLKPRDKK